MVTFSTPVGWIKKKQKWILGDVRRALRGVAVRRPQEQEHGGRLKALSGGRGFLMLGCSLHAGSPQGTGLVQGLPGQREKVSFESKGQEKTYYQEVEENCSAKL